MGLHGELLSQRYLSMLFFGPGMFAKYWVSQCEDFCDSACIRGMCVASFPQRSWKFIPKVGSSKGCPGTVVWRGFRRANESTRVNVPWNSRRSSSHMLKIGVD